MESDQVEKGLKLKCLASLLIKFGKDGNISVKERKDREDDLSSNNQTEPEEDEEEEEATDDEGRNEGMMGIGSLSEFPEKSRIALAIESLWDEIEVIRDWQSMSDYLLLDHSTVITNTTKNGRTSKSNKNRRGSLMRTDEEEEDEEEFESVEEGCKLTENEENVLLEIFLVTLSQSTELLTEEESSIKKDKLKKKKRKLKQKQKQKEGITTEEDEEEEEESEGDDVEIDGIELIENSNKIEISKVMIQVLPKFYIKYCHDPIKLFEILRIPKLLSLGLYLELRMVSAYENLWDILINEYLKQNVQRTISIISSTINHLLNYSKSLSHINQKKIETLNKSLFKNLINLAFKEDDGDRMIDLETCGFELDEIDRFYFALIKVFYFFRTRDLSGFLLGINNDEEDDDGDQMLVDGYVKKQVVVDIIFGLANRGRLNYPEETKMVEVAIEILQLNFMWSCANSSRMINEGLGIEEETEKKKKEVELKGLVDKVSNFRDRFLDLMKEFAIDPECIACDNIKRAAFIHMLNIYLISYGTSMPDQLRIDCDQQTQFRCAGFIAAEIERFGNEMKEKEYEKRRMRIDLDGEEEEEEEEEEVNVGGKKGKGKEKEKKLSQLARQRMYRTTSFKEIKNQEEFELLITTFTKSICCGIIEFEHSNLILSNFNRFGDVFDLSIEILMGSLKGFCFGNEKEIQFERKKEGLAKTVSESLKESFKLFLNEEIDSEEQFLKVCKLLGSTIVIRGARLSIKSILNSKSYITLHQELIEWVFNKIIEFQKNDLNELDKIAIFFKGLVSLLIGMDGRSALKIKSLIDLSVEKDRIEIPATSKSWDPYRTYIKRLISIMAKDPSIKRAAKLTLNRKADKNGTEAIEEEDEPVGVNEEAMNVGPGAEQEGGGEGAQERLQSEIQDGSEEGSDAHPDIGTKKTSGPSAIAKGKARAVSDDIPSDEEEVEEEEEPIQLEHQSQGKRKQKEERMRF
ncbi:uncharacterized protein MELLADRAFT_86914 [Melampsora larici-populina 98AG31]|uniref:Cohesin subunit SCC3/SA HEAT-repeats domain-containing protein n=1 Tax=Melampsora larici-populina (strain 98AG31 / pathotype 3-4-7) TaxID=747676 RepID=F4R3U5_MELLP|nr:uncharacterized protein MELLADRAFT_86914 [Melampsora larici-populina 98AG31]EGG13105.1 hypothetical protein MELLADRAFT_86914 [Melampsora larici-populina 98AG31]